MVNKFPFEGEEGEVKIRFRLNGPDIAEQELIVGRQGLRVGRSRENNLALNHRELSRQHLRVMWRDDQYYVEDLNSSNGTILNEDKLQGRQALPLAEGDYIRFGPYLLTLLEFFEEERERPQLRLLDEKPAAVSVNGFTGYPPGIPRDKSTWLKYLPAIYSEDEFIGRYLLIAESIMGPLIWIIDNFDQYLTPSMAPLEWVEWLASWFDVMLVPELPEARQRAILTQIGWLFLRRGTHAGLERLLELYFGVNVTIVEPKDEPCHFIVQIPMSESDIKVERDTIEYLIRSQSPAFASFALEIS